MAQIFERKARKPYTCSYCEGAIAKGESYLYYLVGGPPQHVHSACFR